MHAQPAIQEHLVEVDGRRVRVLRCAGERTPLAPAFVIEAACGWHATMYVGLIEMLAHIGPVVAYDRSGLGRSDAGGACDGETRAHELHSLLETIALAPPYILVGHSIGALYLRCYAGHHLDRLLGLVFLDGTHPLVPSVIRGRMPLPERARVVLAHAARLVGVVNRRALQITTTQAEMRLLSEASVQAARSRLDDLPLLVLTAGRRTEQELRGSEDPDHFMEVWMLLQRDLLRLSSRAVHRVLEEAGHCDLVTDSRHARWVGDEILEFVKGIEAARMRSTCATRS